jgi:hypothetical protein
MGLLGTKICRKCGEVKELGEFYSCESNLDGRQGACKECTKKEANKRYQNPVVKSQMANQHQIPEVKFRRKEYNYRYNRRPEIKAKTKERDHERNQKPGVKARSKELSQSPRAKAKRKEHDQKPEVRARRRARQKERFIKDQTFKIGANLRSRMSYAIKGKQKVGSAVKNLGCPIPEFIGYIETKFWPGMAWKDWGKGPGKWQLDHIVPLTAFDLSDPKQYLLAAHYTNYQPLWVEDNNRKKAFVPTVLAQPVPFCGMMLAVALDENNQAVIKCFK